MSEEKSRGAREARAEKDVPETKLRRDVPEGNRGATS
jgi:hypothetical protein